MFAALNQKFFDALPASWRQQWQGLSARERILVKQLVWVLTFAVLYFAVWAPISDGLNQAQRKQQQAQKDWIWLTQQAEKNVSQQSRVSQVSLSTQSRLTAYTQQQLRLQNIFTYMSRITPINKRTSSGIELYFNLVPAPAFMRWLSKMEKEGLIAHSLEVKPKQTGMIEATVSFEVML